MPRPKAKPLETTEELAERLFVEADRFGEAGRHSEAFQLFRASSELGDMGARLSLGNYYSSGTGTRKSLPLAESCYKSCFKAGMSAGANNLAINKRNAGDLPAAILWFKKAIALDDGDAAVDLAKLYFKLGRTKAAIAALNQALSFRIRTGITEDGHDEARELLKKINS